MEVWTYSKRRRAGQDDPRAARTGSIRVLRSFLALLSADPGCHGGVGESFEVVGKPSGYVQAGGANHQPDRKRKILLHKAEIRKLRTKLEQRGFTLVPLQIYFNARGLAKVELALARGKRKYDKRRKIEDRAQKKDIDRHMKRYRRKH